MTRYRYRRLSVGATSTYCAHDDQGNAVAYVRRELWYRVPRHERWSAQRVDQSWTERQHGATRDEAVQKAIDTDPSEAHTAKTAKKRPGRTNAEARATEPTQEEP